jgi:formylglycine-generating enzyme required for sulfatase activity
VSSPFARWAALDAAERRVALDAVLEQLPAWLELVDAESASPRFVDRRHGEGWRLFSGGPFVMGATAERAEATEAALARRLDVYWSPEVHSPPRALTLLPFLLMEEPVRGREGDANWYLGDVVAAVQETLAERGVRLPSDAEWEFAHRAVLASPAGWLTGEMELCADGWLPSLERVPVDGRPVPGGPAVCREGSLDPGDVEYAMPARLPLASVRLVQLRAALDVPATPR